MKTQLRKVKICVFPGCEGYQWSRGYCSKHYTKLKKSGSLDTVKFRGTMLERFHRSYVINEVTGCW